MVIRGRRLSKSTFGANNEYMYDILSHQIPIIYPQSIRELVGNELVYTMTVDGVPDLLCVQKFKRVA